MMQEEEAEGIDLEDEMNAALQEIGRGGKKIRKLEAHANSKARAAEAEKNNDKVNKIKAKLSKCSQI